jgi:hypothetical protein
MENVLKIIVRKNIKPNKKSVLWSSKASSNEKIVYKQK